MNVFGTYTHRRDDDGLESVHNVHAEGVPLIGSSTLCGNTDRPDIVWHPTKKRVSCSCCLAIINQVRQQHPSAPQGVE